MTISDFSYSLTVLSGSVVNPEAALFNVKLLKNGLRRLII
jgi:hypothetical protein